MYQSEGENLPTVEQLPNELLLVNDYLPWKKNCSISVIVLRGSRDDPPHLAGGAHAIEHLMFRGCTKLPSYELIDDLVELNSAIFRAETGYEFTRFEMHLPTDRFLAGAEMLSAILGAPLFRAEDIEDVKREILSETDKLHDSPEAWIAHHINRAAWGERQPMGRSIGGTRESISSLTKSILESQFERLYVANAMAVVVTGGTRLDFEVASQFFGRIPKGPIAPRTAPAWRYGSGQFDERPTAKLAHWGAVLPGIRSDDPEKTAYYSMSEILQSRLNRSIKNGDATTYEITTDFEPFQDCGLFRIHSYSSPEVVGTAISNSVAQMTRLAADGPNQQELARFQAGYRGSLLRYIETTDGLNDHWSRQLIDGKRSFVTPMEVDGKIRAITSEQVQAQAKRLTSGLKDLRLLAVTPSGVGSELLRATQRAVLEAGLDDAEGLVA